MVFRLPLSGNKKTDLKKYIEKVKTAVNPSNEKSTADYTYTVPRARVLIRKKQWGSLREEFAELSRSFQENNKPIEVNITRGLVASSSPSKSKKRVRISQQNKYDKSPRVIQEADVIKETITVPKEGSSSTQGSIYKYIKGMLTQKITRLINSTLRPNQVYDDPDYSRQKRAAHLSNSNMDTGLQIRFLAAITDKKEITFESDEGSLLEVQGFSNITVNNTLQGTNASANLNLPIPENIAFIFDGDISNQTYLSGLAGEDVNFANKAATGATVSSGRGKLGGEYFRLGGKFIFEPMDSVYIFMSSSFPEYASDGTEFGWSKLYPNGADTSEFKDGQEQVFEGLIDTVSYSYDANSGSYNLSLQVTNITKYLSMSQFNYKPAGGYNVGAESKTLYNINNGVAKIKDYITYDIPEFYGLGTDAQKSSIDKTVSLLDKGLAGLTPQQCIQVIVTGKRDNIVAETNEEYLKQLGESIEAVNRKLGDFRTLLVDESPGSRGTFVKFVPSYQPESLKEGANQLILPSHKYMQNISPYLRMIGDIKVWQAEFENSLSFCEATASQLMFEFYPDEQGNLMFVPPRVNTRPYWEIKTTNDNGVEIKELILKDNTTLVQIDEYDGTSNSAKAEQKQLEGSDSPIFTFGSRAWVLDEAMLISKTITEDGKQVATRVSIQATAEYIGTFQPAGLFQGHVMDPGMWINYGYREHPQISCPWISSAEAALLYARAVQVYLNANIIQGSVTVVGDAKYHVGDTLYIPSNGLLFYITAVTHNFSVGSSFQTTLTLGWGHGLFETIYHPFGFDSQGFFNTTGKIGRAVHRVNKKIAEYDQAIRQWKQEREKLRSYEINVNTQMRSVSSNEEINAKATEIADLEEASSQIKATTEENTARLNVITNSLLPNAIANKQRMKAKVDKLIAKYNAESDEVAKELLGAQLDIASKDLTATESEVNNLKSEETSLKATVQENNSSLKEVEQSIANKKKELKELEKTDGNKATELEDRIDQIQKGITECDKNIERLEANRATFRQYHEVIPEADLENEKKKLKQLLATEFMKSITEAHKKGLY